MTDMNCGTCLMQQALQTLKMALQYMSTSGVTNKSWEIISPGPSQLHQCQKRQEKLIDNYYNFICREFKIFKKQSYISFRHSHERKQQKDLQGASQSKIEAVLQHRQECLFVVLVICRQCIISKIKAYMYIITSVYIYLHSFIKIRSALKLLAKDFHQLVY